MTHSSLSVRTIVGLMILLGAAAPASAQSPGAATSFAIVGGTAVSANGTGSIINGDVGVSPGTAITGFPAAANTVPPYSTHSNDGSAINAQASTLVLYNTLAAAGPATPILPALGGQVLGPGVYSTGAADLAGGGVLTLSGGGLYIFKIASTLTANTTSTVALLAGANACNVYWQVTAAATLNGVNFAGNVVAQAAVTLGTGAILAGRALTTSLGAVTLTSTNTVGGCSTPNALPPVTTATDLFIIKSHTGPFVVGQNATYTIQTLNSGTTASNGLITVTDTLPAGLTFVSATGVNSWTCSASGQVVTCTTPAAVGNGSLGNNITITVTPTAAAVPSVTNTAVVTGGGDSNPANNTTADVTLVVLSVPTLPEWAMFGLLALLATAGTVALRRRSGLGRG